MAEESPTDKPVAPVRLDDHSLTLVIKGLAEELRDRGVGDKEKDNPGTSTSDGKSAYRCSPCPASTLAMGCDSHGRGTSKIGNC